MSNMRKIAPKVQEKKNKKLVLDCFKNAVLEFKTGKTADYTNFIALQIL